MSIQRDPDGRRSVRVEVEVPGTPEQVWQAIATGPGITAWFVPTQVEPRNGGTMTFDFGQGMVSTATLTAWEPPFRLTADSPGWTPEMPSMATEWTVTAKAGGTCVVRVVHSLFASTDDWDGQLEGTESGWPSYFRVLRRYLEHFAGQAGAQLQATAMTSESVAAVWSTLVDALQLQAAAPGRRVTARLADAITIVGTIDRVDTPTNGHCVLIQLTEPAPGTLMVGAYACGGTMASMTTYLYGPRAHAIADAARPKVQAWLAERLPAPM